MTIGIARPYIRTSQGHQVFNPDMDDDIMILPKVDCHWPYYVYLNKRDLEAMLTLFDNKETESGT